jgi:hypothetical protein
VGHIREPEKQRAGVYGTARQMVSCLTDREVCQWITLLRDATVDTDPRPQFVPEDFVEPVEPFSVTSPSLHIVKESEFLQMDMRAVLTVYLS